MVCFTKKEQEEIINEFLTVIDICDKKRFIKSDIETCKKCKFNYGNMYMYKSLPSDIAKNICKFNYEECNKCNKLKNIVEYVDKNNVHMIDNIINILNEKEKYQINGSGYSNEINNSIFIYVNLFKYPTYKNILNKINHDEKKYYNKEMHEEMKNYYNNLWKENKDYDDKKSYIENYYTSLRYRFIQEFDDNIDKHINLRDDLYKFVKDKFKFIETIMIKIFNMINKPKINSTNLMLVLYYDCVSNIQEKITNTNNGYFGSYDFEKYLDNRFPFLDKKEYIKIKKIEYNKVGKKLYNDIKMPDNEYLKNASDFD